MSNQLNDWLGALLGAPSLPGAKCRGRSHLFDEAQPGENATQRHNQAAGLCSRCPSLAACTEWVDSLPKAKRPPGVVAGRIPVRRGGQATEGTQPPSAPGGRRTAEIPDVTTPLVGDRPR